MERRGQIVRKLIRTFCPVVLGESFEDFTKTALLFPDFTFRDVTVLIGVFAFYFALVLDGIFYWAIDTHFLMLPRKSLGPFLNEVHLSYGTALMEMVIMRLYCIYLRIKHGKHSIKWFNMACEAKKERYPLLINLVRFFFFQLWCSATMIFFVNHLAKLVSERSTPIDYVVNIAWFASEIVLFRVVVLEFPLMFMMAYACFIFVNEKLNRIIEDFKKPQLDLNVIVSYKRLVKWVADMNSLMNLISLLNNLSVMPSISLYIVVAITEAEDLDQIVLKCVYLSAAFIFVIRGIVMTIVVAKIDSSSRVLYKLLASRLARSESNGPISKLSLLSIMEDLSSSKNHLCVKEFSGSPSDQMNVLTNLFTIAQFVMLLRSFSIRLGF